MMADLCGFEQATYSKKELGHSKIREEEWKRFAQLLGVSIDEIKNDGYDEITIPRALYETIIRHNVDLKIEVKALKHRLKILTL